MAFLALSHKNLEFSLRMSLEQMVVGRMILPRYLYTSAFWITIPLNIIALLSFFPNTITLVFNSFTTIIFLERNLCNPFNCFCIYAYGIFFVTGVTTWRKLVMMTSSNGNIFRVTGHLCGKFTGYGWIPRTKPVKRSFEAFFNRRLNKRLSKQWWNWWFETPSRPL